MDSDADVARIISPGGDWFVITSTADNNKVLERFRALDWAPAIAVYKDRLCSGAHAERTSLRRARPSELPRENEPQKPT